MGNCRTGLSQVYPQHAWEMEVQNVVGTDFLTTLPIPE